MVVQSDNATEPWVASAGSQRAKEKSSRSGLSAGIGWKTWPSCGPASSAPSTARAGSRRFGMLCPLRAHTEVPYRMKFLWETRRLLKRPWAARTVGLQRHRPAEHRVVCRVGDAAPSWPLTTFQSWFRVLGWFRSLLYNVRGGFRWFQAGPAANRVHHIIEGYTINAGDTTPRVYPSLMVRRNPRGSVTAAQQLLSREPPTGAAAL